VTRYRPPRLLEPSDRLAEVTCRSAEQTDRLRRHAHQSASSGGTKIFVVTTAASRVVVAFYAWRMAQVDIESAPPRLRKGSGRYPQPVALLARLGVDIKHEGHGLGAGLLIDVIARLVDLSNDIGCRGLLIHAESAQARDFYHHLVPELQASPTDELHLLLLTKDARRTLLAR